MLEDDYVESVWNQVATSAVKYRELFPHSMRSGADQVEGREVFDEHKHYANWLASVIGEVVQKCTVDTTPHGANARSKTKQQRDTSWSTISAIRRRVVDYTNFHIPDSSRKLMMILDIHKLPWGVLSNHGPYFEMVVKDLKRREQQTVFEPYRVNLRHALFLNAFGLGPGLDGLPSTEYFAKVKQAFDNKPRSHEPLPQAPIARDYYFLGSTNSTLDHNSQGLRSLGVRTALVGANIESSSSTVDIGKQSGSYFAQLDSLDDVYSLILGPEIGEHYRTMSLDDLAALSKDLSRTQTSRRNKCLPLAKVFANQETISVPTKKQEESDKNVTPKAHNIEYKSEALSQREIGLRDLDIDDPFERKRAFVPEDTLEPIH